MKCFKEFLGESRAEFEYQLLGRLQSDVDTFLGQSVANEKRLWAGNVKDQIAKMKEIYNGLKVKPDWITMKDIEKYEKAMLKKVSK